RNSKSQNNSTLRRENPFPIKSQAFESSETASRQTRRMTICLRWTETSESRLYVEGLDGLVVETEITSNTCKLSLDDINITQVSEAIRQLSTIGIDIPFFRTTFSPSLPDFKREHDKF